MYMQGQNDTRREYFPIWLMPIREPHLPGYQMCRPVVTTVAIICLDADLQSSWNRKERRTPNH
jgi:hypothetical protein